MTTLYYMVGIPASGKSTYAQILVRKEGAIWLSSDNIREELFGDESIQEDSSEVFTLMKERTIENLKNGNNVVYDATNIYSEFRKKDCEAFRPYVDRIICEFIDTGLKEALYRNAIRSRFVPEKVIARMFINLEDPTLNDGFDLIMTHRLG